MKSIPWTAHQIDSYISEYRPRRMLLKLAARCNINCTYCYWFQDKDVYSRPKCLSQQAELLLLARLDEYFEFSGPIKFLISFHGGEPLLFGKSRFTKLCYNLRQVAEMHHVDLRLSIQTNGIMLDKEWANIFVSFRVSVGISLDGLKVDNDHARLDFRGKSTYSSVVNGIRSAQEAGLDVGILAVWNPGSESLEICQHFANDLGITSIDFLMPDGTRDDAVDCSGMVKFYSEIFNIWYFSDVKGIDIRIAQNLLKLLFSNDGDTESLGYGPTTTFSIATDGQYEVLDVLNVLKNGSTRTTASLQDTRIADINTIPGWKDQVRSSLSLCDICVQCPYVRQCGGGYLPSRYSLINGFSNPSRNCSELKLIFDHVRKTVLSDLKNLYVAKSSS